MKNEGTNLLLLTMSAFWSSSRWAPEGREVSHYVVVIDRFHCTNVFWDQGFPFLDVITYPYSNFNSGLTEEPLTFGMDK